MKCDRFVGRGDSVDTNSLHGAHHWKLRANLSSSGSSVRSEAAPVAQSVRALSKSKKRPFENEVLNACHQKSKARPLSSDDESLNNPPLSVLQKNNKEYLSVPRTRTFSFKTLEDKSKVQITVNSEVHHENNDSTPNVDGLRSDAVSKNDLLRGFKIC